MLRLFFFCHFLFPECSVDLKTHLLFFNLSMRQTNTQYVFNWTTLYGFYFVVFYFVADIFYLFQLPWWFSGILFFCCNMKQIKSFLTQNGLQQPYIFVIGSNVGSCKWREFLRAFHITCMEYFRSVRTAVYWFCTHLIWAPKLHCCGQKHFLWK